MTKLTADEFKKHAEQGLTIIDTRDALKVLDGMYSGSLVVLFDDHFLSTLQQLTAADDKLLIVTDEEHADKVYRVIKNSAGHEVVGYFVWQADFFTSENPLDFIISIDADEFAMDYHYDEFYLIDTRPAEQFDEEHVEDAENITMPDLNTALADFDTNGSYYVYAETDSEALAAGSVFKKFGLDRLRVVEASFDDIKKSGVPVFTKKKKKAGENFSSN